MSTEVAVENKKRQIREAQMEAERAVQEELGLRETTDTVYRPYVPAVFTLAPDMTIESTWDGYWYLGRPSAEELRQDLRAIARRVRPDWSAPTP